MVQRKVRALDSARSSAPGSTPGSAGRPFITQNAGRTTFTNRTPFFCFPKTWQACHQENGDNFWELGSTLLLPQPKARGNAGAESVRGLVSISSAWPSRWSPVTLPEAPGALGHQWHPRQCLL